MLGVSRRCCEGGSRDGGDAARGVQRGSDGVRCPCSTALLGRSQRQLCPLALCLLPVPGPARRKLSPLPPDAPGLTLLPSASPAAPGAIRPPFPQAVGVQDTGAETRRGVPCLWGGGSSPSCGRGRPRNPPHSARRWAEAGANSLARAVCWPHSRSEPWS